MDNTNNDLAPRQRVNKPIELTKLQLELLRIKSKQLDPLVRIGKAGLSEGAIQYIKNIMHAHGLVKFKVLKNAKDTGSMDTIIEEAATKCNGMLIDRIGLTFTLYTPGSRNYRNVLK